jgi:hypothetical protein
VSAAVHLGWSSTDTGTTELPRIYWQPLEDAPTQVLHVVFDLPPSPQEAPTPPPRRLPRRLRRRAASHLALLATAAAGFTTALTAGGAL